MAILKQIDLEFMKRKIEHLKLSGCEYPIPSHDGFNKIEIS